MRLFLFCKGGFMKSLWLILILLNAAVGLSEEALKCDTPEHRQLDYWIGSWDVYDQKTNKLVGSSRIEKRLAGCVIFESWSGSDNFEGHSFNLYNREAAKWQQVWVDSRGQRIDFNGEVRQDGIHYEGPFRSAGKEVLARMKFLKLQDQKVRQLWEQSTDNGKTWKTEF